MVKQSVHTLAYAIVYTATLLLMLVWLHIPVRWAYADSAEDEAKRTSGHNDCCPTERWSFGVVPVAGRGLWDGGGFTSEDAEYLEHGGTMAAGAVIQWEWAQERRARFGLEGSFILVGGVLDRLLDSEAPKRIPGMYARIGVTARWPFTIIEDRWIFNLAMGAGILGFVIPGKAGNELNEDEPTFGGIGIAVTPLTCGFEWPIPDTAWSIGLQVDVLEFGGAISIGGASPQWNVAQQYFLFALGRTVLGVHVRW